MRVPLRERSFGELVGLCFSVAAGNFGQLFLLAFLLNLPGALLGSLQQGIVQETSNPLFVVTMALALLVFLLTAPLLQAATIRVVAGSFTGESASLGECLRVALRRVLPLIGYGLVTGLITSLGFLLCIAPGLMFVTWYYLGASVLVIEQLGVGRAMERSKRMSEGRRWEILGFFLVTNLLFQGVIVGVSALVGYVLDPMLAPWVNLPIASLLSLPLAVAPVAYYFNLRVTKEGFDLERLSDLIRSIGGDKPQGAS